ncbi:MAG: glycosyltransferase family 39 protein, partial [Blastocatellia bacterium]
MLVSCWRNQQFSYFPYNMRFTYNPEFSENYSQAASLHFYLLVALALLLLLGGLHKGDLSGYDDAAYAYEAKTILATGDWWTLSLNGSQDFDKPPLFVWCLAISMQVFGKSDFAAKLPAALFGFGTILLVYQLAQELTGCKWISIFSMLVLVSTQYFLKYATHAMTGVPFTFFFTLAIWLYLKGYRQSQHWLFCGFAFGAANWIRAPVGWLVIAIIVIHLLFTRQFFRLRSGWLQGGLGLGAALSLSWYVVNYLIHGKLFITEHFFNLNNHVFEVSPPLAWEQVRSLFHYPYLLLRHYWPWLPLLLIGLIGQAKKALRYQDTAASLLLI